MMFEEIERFVKARYKDAKEIKKYASEIASEIAERMEYGRKAAEYATLVFKLEMEKAKIDTSIKKMKTAKSAAQNNALSIQSDNPNIIYNNKKKLLLNKLNELTEKSEQAKNSIELCIRSANERKEYYQNKIFG